VSLAPGIGELSQHCPAALRSAMTGIRADAAVLVDVRVLLAGLRAHCARPRTCLDLRSEKPCVRKAPGEHARRSPSDVRAIEVDANAAPQAGYVLFREAGVRASDAHDLRFDAGLHALSLGERGEMVVVGIR
jgi:hypothetical protein